MLIRCSCGYDGWADGVDQTIFQCPKCKKEYDSQTYTYPKNKEEPVAKLQVWFGQYWINDIFNTEEFKIVQEDGYIYIYKKNNR